MTTTMTMMISFTSILWMIQSITMTILPVHGYTIFVTTTSSPTSFFVQQKTVKYTALKSTLQTADDATTRNKAEVVLGAISTPISQLSKTLKGKGRAQLVWDCYRIGIDPALFFADSPSQQPQAQQAEKSVLSKFITHQEDEEETIRSLFPTSRSSQSLGPSALVKLAETYGNKTLENGVASLASISKSKDGTTKMLITLEEDGLQVESVIIPWMERGWSTLCISSQVGCRQGCTFCATGRMGLKRSLTSDEILSQVFFAKKINRLIPTLPEITNVVFMGMGEPTDNIDSVSRTIEILTDESLYQLKRNGITVSTVAPTPKAFEQLVEVKAVIAWSIHAANDATRQRIVPTAKYSVNELKQGLIQALKRKPKNLQNVMLEVALIHNVNDSIDDAIQMAKVANDIINSISNDKMKLMVNLIPYNDIGGPLGYEKPTEERVKAYQQVLWDRGVYTHVRETRGDDEDAACGQLATRAIKKKEDREEEKVTL